MRNRNNNVVGTTVYLTPRKPRNPKDRRLQQPIPFDVALRQFKKAVERAGIIQEVRKREYYEKPNQKRNRKKAEAVRRHARKIAKEKIVSNLPRGFRVKKSR